MNRFRIALNKNKIGCYIWIDLIDWMNIFGHYITHAKSLETNEKASIVSWHWTQRKSFKGEEDKVRVSEVHLMWHKRLSKHLFVPLFKDNNFLL